MVENILKGKIMLECKQKNSDPLKYQLIVSLLNKHNPNVLLSSILIRVIS